MCRSFSLGFFLLLFILIFLYFFFVLPLFLFPLPSVAPPSPLSYRFSLFSSYYSVSIFPRGCIFRSRNVSTQCSTAVRNLPSPTELHVSGTYHHRLNFISLTMLGKTLTLQIIYSAFSAHWRLLMGTIGPTVLSEASSTYFSHRADLQSDPSFALIG